MRRISLALALVGAVAATGCSGGAKRSSDTGAAPGVGEGTFSITVQNGQGQTNGALAIKGGYVTSNPSGISCGVDETGTALTACQAPFALGTPVELTAHVSGELDPNYLGDTDLDPATPPAPYLPYLFLGWAGDCQGNGACALSGNADKYVVVTFGGKRTGHPNWADPSQHGPKFRAYVNGDTTWDCKVCHGASYQGQGLAVSCTGCHGAALVTFVEQNPTLGAVHGTAEYAALFATVANGPAVTTVCVGCHTSQAAAFMDTQHWNWKGATPQLFELKDFALADPLVLQNPGTIGKANLINNFCVSVAANERRCEQCHAGYGDAAANVSVRTATYVNNPTRVDCLICHTSKIQGDMKGSASATDTATPLYNKVAGAFGAAGWAVGPGMSSASTAQLQIFATNIQLPTRENCGYCHFNGGGADSVKIMSTALRTPSVGVDVHMSNDTANGGQNMTCADCHAASNHQIKGAGVHTPTNYARLDCSECHGLAPHALAALNVHTNAIACQTCHIPAFARGKPQKLDWDWSTAGAKQISADGTISACVSGTTEVAYDNNNCATAGGVKVKKYDFMKGTFAWGQNVKPTYRWYNGKMTHATTSDKGAFTGETGLTPALTDRITLSSPLGARGNGKISPFKVMTGRQAVYVDDATGNSFIITPNLFHDPADGADGGFWGVLAAQPPSTTHQYTYLGTVVPDAFGAPNAPLAGNFVLNQTASFLGTSFGGYTVNVAGDQTVTYPIETLLAKNFTKGATLAGQVAAGTPTFAKYDGTNPGWDWRYTKMYLDLEHEVAPAAQAIGAGGNCAACHSANPVIPICELYAGVPAADLPWGVTCP